MPRAEADRRRRVCYVRHSHYLYAAHLHRNVQALGESGFEVDVIVLRRPGEPMRETLMPGVHIYRLPVAHHRGRLGAYLLEYLAFFLLAFVLVSWLHVRRHFDFVEVDNMPDALVFAALLPKLTGAQIILYVADCMADLIVSSNGLSALHPVVRLLTLQELASARFADQVIVPNAATARRLVRGVIAPDKLTLVLNSPDDERLFVRREHHTSRGEADRFRIVTHGTLIERYGVQVLLAALPKIAEDVPGVEVDVYGDGEYRDELQAQARKLGIANRVRFWGFVPYVELPGRLSEADLAYAGPLVDLLVANKMLEYEALGIPMVLARWPALQDHFPDECVAYVTHGDADELARAVVELYRHPDRAQAMAARASNHYQASHRWALQRSAYLQLFEDAPAVLSRVPAREDTLTLA